MLILVIHTCQGTFCTDLFLENFTLIFGFFYIPHGIKIMQSTPRWQHLNLNGLKFTTVLVVGYRVSNVIRFCRVLQESVCYYLDGST